MLLFSKKGQSVEYAALISMVVLVTVLGFYFFFQQSTSQTDNLDIQRVQNIGEDIIKASEDVYYQPFSQRTLVVDFPKATTEIRQLDSKTIRITIKTSKGEREYIFYSDNHIDLYVPTAINPSGIQKLLVKNNDYYSCITLPGQACPEPNCWDDDSDGYNFTHPECGTPDCDDNNASINPGTIEICNNGYDDNCDGLVDLADPACCPDDDGDGYFFAGGLCPAPEDCNDTNASINPGASEICTNGVDDDCDGFIDGADAECSGCGTFDADGNWIVNNIQYCKDVTMTLTGNLRILGTGNLTFNNVTLYMNTTDVNGSYNISVDANGAFTVYDSTITKGLSDGRYGFWAKRWSHFSMKDSYVSYAGWDWVEGAQGLYIQAKMEEFSGNTIERNYDGIRIFDVNDNIVENNIFRNCINAGVTVYSSTMNTVVRNNIVEDSQMHSMYIKGFNTTLINNTLTNASSKNLWLYHAQNSLVRDNIIEHHNGYYGAVDFTTAHNNIMINNTIRYVLGDGIYIHDNSQNNTIFNNTIYNITQKGISIINSDNDNIAGNVVYDVYEGIYVGWSASYNYLAYNDVSHYSHKGIYIHSGDYTTLTNNVVRDAPASYGIFIYNNDNFMSYNLVYNTSVGIVLNGQNCTASHDFARDNSVGLIFDEANNTVYNYTGWHNAQNLQYFGLIGNNTIYDSNISDSSGWDIQVQDAGTYGMNSTILNTSLDLENVRYWLGTSCGDGTNCSINIYWYYIATVTNSLGAPVQGVNVSANNKFGLISDSKLTDANGRAVLKVKQIELRNATWNVSYEPFTVLVTKSGYLGNISWPVYVNKSMEVNFTIYESAGASVSSCGNIFQDSILTQDVTSIGTCFNIVSDNVILDCAGHKITYSTGINDTYGINNTGGYDNITIRNCNIEKMNTRWGSNAIQMNNNARNISILNNRIYVEGQWAYGIRLRPDVEDILIANNNITTRGYRAEAVMLYDNVNYGVIKDNILNTTGTESDAIFLGTNSIFNQVINNLVYTSGSNAVAIFVANSLNSYVDSNVVATTGTSGEGIWVGGTGNTVTNNEVSTIGWTLTDGIHLSNAMNNVIAHNNITTAGWFINYGIGLLQNSHDNEVYDNIIISQDVGISLRDASRNYVHDLDITAANTGIRLYDANDSIFKNVKINPTPEDIHMQEDALNNSLVNVSFDITSINTVDPFLQNLSIQWYFDALVLDETNGMPIPGAHVELWDSTGYLLYDRTTNGAGLVRLYNITDYYVSGGPNYDTRNNHTIYVHHAGYSEFNGSVNISTNMRYTVSLGP